MKVMLFAIATKHTNAGRPPTKEAVLAMHKFNEELEKAGVLLDLGGLTPTSRGVRVKYSGGKCTVIDGPFAEAKEMIADVRPGVTNRASEAKHASSAARRAAGSCSASTST